MRGFITFAGNPVLSTPNGERLARALAKLDFMVAIDCYLNETTRHAHLILPPLHSLEQSHYDVVFHTLAVRNTAKYSPPVVKPGKDGLADWQILYELGMRLGGLRTGAKLLDRGLHLGWKLGLRFTPDRMIDLLLRFGSYGDRFIPGHRGLNLKKVAKAPHGIDLGPLQPSRNKKVRTADGRVDLAPAPLLEDARRLDGWLGDAKAQGLVLIGRRHLRTNNSWMHNVHSLVKGPPRDELLMHPSDAARLALAQGAQVRVRSRTGEVTARLSISDDIRLGVVSLPHGYGHAGNEAQHIASAVVGPNVNALTDELFLEPVVGTAVLNGVPVTVLEAPAA
jgi:anaerobic selenocysteine-containing dehydrogenase